MRFVNQCITLLYFPFFLKYRLVNSIKTRQELVYLPLHNKLRTFITTTTWELSTFWTYFSTPIEHSFELFSDCIGYLESSLSLNGVAKVEKIESVMSFDQVCIKSTSSRSLQLTVVRWRLRGRSSLILRVFDLYNGGLAGGEPNWTRLICAQLLLRGDHSLRIHQIWKGFALG